MKLADLADLRFSYDAIGATRYEETPPDYHRLDLRTRIGAGDEVFRKAGEAVTTWQMHRGAGMRIDATDTPAVIGANVLGRLGVGPLSLTIPCRVVWTADDDDHIGFAYGTLPGHPESGEESFLVTRDPDGVYFTLRAYSRPGAWYTRLSGPLGRSTQHLFARRYTQALQRLVA
ncbi:conserved hypothetical protein [Kribbella flavida DSM 17836]|uniref:DUF1990 domain-containing protein n=1 Tax=Kribbella flavida (strain DSM 17836 / JCM 10339 / NBRC 14399) TaxID=479435 RepID=D2Q2X7_KRIFD|nr:DUF1990 domain-containing protein [Kribbella flavida]ADB30308.1 conserved hypothetical protein [Kribbella flavida DSM 17836]